MDENESSTQVQDELASEVNESLGMTEGNHEIAESEPNEKPQGSEGSHANETLSVQKRLKAQRRAHEREVRDLHSRIGELESRMTTPNHHNESANNPYTPPESGSIEEHIHKAVSFALQHKENEERKAHEAKNAAHVHRQYQDFQKHLDTMGDKYDDFHDVVLGRDTPYTSAMRDYALTLPKSGEGAAGEVLYKLGKNPKELERISKLHPLDQAVEMAKLSHALISGGENKGSQSARPLGQIKNNPVSNSHTVNEKTSVSDLRGRMKSGSWK